MHKELKKKGTLKGIIFYFVISNVYLIELITTKTVFPKNLSSVAMQHKQFWKIASRVAGPGWYCPHMDPTPLPKQKAPTLKKNRVPIRIQPEKMQPPIIFTS